MSNLSFLDFVFIGFGIFFLFLIGRYLAKEVYDLLDFFVAKRKGSIFLATLSFVSSEISAMTILGVPAVSFKDDWSYLSFFIGSAISRVVISYFFIPVFYKYNCITIYDFVGQRFSTSVQTTTSFFFFITRLFASGIRLYATALGLSVILGFDLATTIFFFIIVSYLFVSYGGIRSVIYTGSYQAISFYVTGFFIIIFILFHIPINNLITMPELWKKLTIFHFSFNFKDPNIFILAILNGVFGSLASFSTDYEVMQKLLTLSTRKQSQKSILYTIIASSILVVIYLSCGTLIYYYLKFNSISYSENPDKIVSYFTVNFIPSPFKGLVFLTVLLASIDLPLVSLSTSFVNDVFLKFKKIEESNVISFTRKVMIVFALILGVVAYSFKNAQGMLWLAFEINGVTVGSMLGVFLLGIFTKYQGESKCIIFSMVLSSALCFSFMILNRRGITNIPWSLFVVIGTIISFSLPQIINYLIKTKK